MDANGCTDPQAQDAIPIENLNLPLENTATKSPRGSESPGRNDARFQNVELLPRRSFESLLQGAQAEQSEESLAADCPVVSKRGESDNRTGVCECVERRVHNNEEEVAASRGKSMARPDKYCMPAVEIP